MIERRGSGSPKSKISKSDLINAVHSLLLDLLGTWDWALFLLEHQASFLQQFPPSWSAFDMWHFQYVVVSPHFSFSKVGLILIEVHFQTHLDQRQQSDCS